MSNIQELQEKLNNSDNKVRLEAIKQAYEVGSHEAYGLLMYAAHHHFSPETRRAAHKGALLLQKKLFEKGTPVGTAEIEQADPVEDSIREALGSPDAQTRIDTIKSIAGNDRKELYPLILKQLHSEQNPQVQKYFILACARLGGNDSQPHLRQFLRSGDQEVRASVVRALGSFGDQENIVLFMLFSRDPAQSVRTEAVKVLENCSKEHLRSAIGKLQERNRDVEKDAIIFSIARFQIEDCYPILEELSKDPSQNIQERAGKALDYVKKSAAPAAQAPDPTREEANPSKEDKPETSYTAVEKSSEAPKEESSSQPSTEDATSELEEEVGSSSAETDKQEENMLRVIRQGEESSALQGLFDLIALNRLTRLGELVEPIKERNSKRVTATFLMAVGQSKDRNLKDFVLESLENPDGRIQANAVEAVRMLDLTEELKSQILPLATQSSNDRVRANSIISLHKTSLIDTKAEIENMLSSSKDNRKLSALYAIQDLMDPAMIPLLEGPIESPNPKVTKKTLEILKNFYLDEEVSAIKLVKDFGLEEEMKVEEIAEEENPGSEGEEESNEPENMESIMESMNSEKNEGYKTESDTKEAPAKETKEETSKDEKKDGLSKIKSAFQNLFKKK